MSYQELVVMPSDTSVRRSLAVLKVQGPYAKNRMQIVHVSNGAVYAFHRHINERVLSLEFEVNPALFANKFQYVRITINGTGRTYRADDFNGNIIRLRRAMRKLPDSFEVKVELSISGDLNKIMIFKLMVTP